MNGAARVASYVAISALMVGPAPAEPLRDPLRFFEGTTVSEGTLRILFKKPFKTRSIGRGKINADGSLELVQRVEEGERAPFQRRWHMKRVGPGRFAGTMSEATGPVTVEEIGDRFRFRFPMKNHVKVEQWVTPLDGGQSARNEVTIRKHGIIVGRMKGTIRRTQ
jgi:hypothetical protein